MILRSRLFFDASNRRRRVKSPVELAVGSVRALEILKPTVSPDALAKSCESMGQSLFAPPSVAGWDGGPAWINTTSTLARTNLALALLSDSDAGLGKRLDPLALARKHGFDSPEAASEFFIDLLVQDAFAPDIRKRVHRLGQTPERQPPGRRPRGRRTGPLLPRIPALLEIRRVRQVLEDAPSCSSPPGRGWPRSGRVRGQASQQPLPAGLPS